MMTDSVQRLLLRCVLEDASGAYLAPLADCPGCGYWMERGPCVRHRAGGAAAARYFGLSARLENAAALVAWPLSPADARTVADAIPGALGRRCRPAAGLDVGLGAAYRALATRLGHGGLR